MGRTLSIAVALTPVVQAAKASQRPGHLDIMCVLGRRDSRSWCCCRQFLAFEIAAALGQTGSPVLACPRAGGGERARVIYGMWGRLETEKKTRMQHALAYSFQRYCKRVIHFPNK